MSSSISVGPVDDGVALALVVGAVLGSLVSVGGAAVDPSGVEDPPEHPASVIAMRPARAAAAEHRLRILTPNGSSVAHLWGAQPGGFRQPSQNVSNECARSSRGAACRTVSEGVWRSAPVSCRTGRLLCLVRGTAIHLASRQLAPTMRHTKVSLS
jgi:hypothetical protein